MLFPIHPKFWPSGRLPCCFHHQLVTFHWFWLTHWAENNASHQWGSEIPWNNTLGVVWSLLCFSPHLGLLFISGFPCQGTFPFLPNVMWLKKNFPHFTQHFSVFRVNGTPLQYSCLENPMGGGARWAAVHGVAKSQTQLSNFTFTFHFHALEKEMATHSSVLAWRIPGTRESGGLPSMGSHRVGHDWSDLAESVCHFIRNPL